MSLTVRLSPKTERTLAALARRRRMTRSDVVREAIEHYAAAQAPAHAGDDSALAAWTDVIGVVDLERGDDARTTGARFTDVVRAKARSRRAR